MYADMCPQRVHSKYYSPPTDQGPLGHDACPSMSFNRSIFNWYSATPVDPTGRYDFANHRDRNFSLAVLQLARSNRSMLWMGDSTTRESFTSGVAPSADIVEFHLYFLAVNTFSNVTASKAHQSMYRSKISTIMGYYSGLVMVVNTGIHCNSVEAMQREVDTFLPYLHNVAVMSGKNNLVMFRESSAQHYSSPNGYYNSTAPPRQCVPLTHLTPGQDYDSSDYRNNMVRERIASSGYNISIIPFWRYTVSPFNFHKLVDVRFVKLENVDCTHFGYTQLFMQPILRGIADRILNGSSHVIVKSMNEFGVPCDLANILPFTGTTTGIVNLHMSSTTSGRMSLARVTG
eukprot:gene21447-27480_t